MRVLHVAKAVVARDLLLALRYRYALAFAAVFFVGATLLPSIATADAGSVVATFSEQVSSSVQVIWICAIVAAMWAHAVVLHRDSRDGSFEQLLLAAHSPLLILGAKAASHWSLSGLPVLIIASVEVMFGLVSTPMSVFLLSSVAVGTMVMSLIAVTMMILAVRQSSGWRLANLFVVLLHVLVAMVTVAISHGLQHNLSLPSAMLMLACVPLVTWPLIHAAIALPQFVPLQNHRS